MILYICQRDTNITDSCDHFARVYIDKFDDRRVLLIVFFFFLHVYSRSKYVVQIRSKRFVKLNTRA